MILPARRFRPVLAAALLGAAFFAPAAVAQEEAKTYPSPGEIVAEAAPSEWVTIAPEDMLVMELGPGAKGEPRRVVIQLMPPPFAQGWIGNIRKLAEAHWWNGTSVNRVQDNYVVQWGDATEKKPLPDGLETVPESAYTVVWEDLSPPLTNNISKAKASLYPWHAKDPWRDAYSGGADFVYGWPIAGNAERAWPIHCYGMVGVGRNLSPDTGTGAELYTVIGQAPRHLDRNIALVGRVIEGMENLSSLPRGTGDLGFYENPEERTPIVSVRLASELPEAERPNFQYLSTESATFARYAEARANRRDPFFNVPAGGADICNIPVPIRKTPAQ
ncbi:peptidylprolyl isomerase [Novosphingopyxis sp. YJ-S2-01]|uniref:peptidylprolyl isomerase n=1 Tax=Novosphingopyxis sp. YJ-S2-01 TaxID=2794021 RepID=UPI0018DCE328|nr:peptidylprolyl isomerase [Novosphingopyxis sp. YJ-S2-01]MBH9536604.1 peptidylprolyl isomerase [Novosphingopyxis sp. YJ-S2-01]